MKRLLALCLLWAACGGKSGTLALRIVTSPADDPFLGASQVRFTVGDDKHVTTVPVAMGHFSFKVSSKPLSQPGTVLVEALDAQGNVVGHGRSPVLSLAAMDQGPVAIWVGRPGQVQPAAAALPKPVAEAAATSVPGLGVLVAGGRDAKGAPVGDSSVYDVYTQSVIPVAPLLKAVAGAVAAPVVGVRAVLYGGSTAPGAGNTGAPDGSLAVFDPTVGYGIWAPLPADPFAPRSFAGVALLANGNALISGGRDGAGLPLGTAALVNPSGALRLTAIASSMTAPRAGHATCAAHFPDGDGALLFGGLAAGSTGPVAERFINSSFVAYDVGAVESRSDATATTMPSGDVLILGGKTAAGVESSGLVISPRTSPPAVKVLPGALSVAREGHTASLTGDELVVCGGADGSGAPQASCDVLDAKSYALVRTVQLAAARRDQVAGVLDNGLVVIAGGRGSDGAPLASIELYTP